MKNLKLTKIVVTVGPAIENPKVLSEIIREGGDVFRFNLKHNTPQWHSNFLKKLKTVAKEAKKMVATIFDLPSSNYKPFRSLLAKLEKEIDFLAVSLIKKPEEIEKIKKANFDARIIAKIETKEATENFEEILNVSDAIMVARGDLGINIPLEKIPYFQKEIVRKCLEKGKPVIVATQMLKSMTDHPLPTRAEVSDVANAVLDYADALMLSEETSIGKYPQRAVSMMAKIATFWERKRNPPFGIDFEIDHQTKAVCYSAYRMWQTPFCQKEKIKAFLVLTKGGMTAQMLSRLRPTLPIVAVTNDKFLARRLALVFGIFPVYLKGEIYKKRTPADIKKLLDIVKKEGFATSGEKVILIYSEDWKSEGKTSVIRVQEIP
jgi:pyruvate kinase